ncbi:MAG: cupin [Thermotoga sp.]|nr:MAG: cupin [Thermotoga sp.]
MKIGEKLKRLRLSKGLTQEELAERTDLTKGFISQIERDKTSPSIETLQQILLALDFDLKSFFSEEKLEKVVFRKDERIPVYDEPIGVKSQILIPNVQEKKLDPYFVVLGPKGQTNRETYHPGEEFGYVISGRLELHLNDRIYRLKARDCFYFKADKKHYVKNPSSKERCKFLWIKVD